MFGYYLVLFKEELELELEEVAAGFCPFAS